jgi:hypothetical protein
MDVYENIIIGNFLFALGVQMTILNRKRGFPPPTSLNLLQQTRPDTVLADVLLSNASICRLIEFKRESNKSPKEREKRQDLEDKFKNTGWPPISREIHWYVDFHAEPDLLTTRVVPYLDFVQNCRHIDLEEFVKLTAEKACGQPLQKRDVINFESYVKYIVAVRGKGDPIRSGAVFFSMTQQGQMRWIPVDHLLDIFKTYEKHHEMVVSRNLAMDRSHEAEARTEHTMQYEP